MHGGAAPGGVQAAPFELALGNDARQACVMRPREPLDGGRVRLGLQFVDDDPVGRARLALWAFRSRPGVTDGADLRSVVRRHRARAA